jgi:hypothetical protein
VQHIEPLAVCTESIGQVEFVVGAAKPAKSVDTHGKWIIAWDQAVEANPVLKK